MEDSDMTFNKIKVQYCSDLHIDVNSLLAWDDMIKPFADILIIAGDTCQISYRLLPKFLKWCSEQFKLIIFVPGNHEYYNNKLNIEECDMGLNILCEKFDNIFFGQKLIHYLSDNVVLLTCTLWTNIDGVEQRVRKHMNDFSKIPEMNILKWKDLHNDHLNWLEKQITYLREQNDKLKILVITHHAPLSRHTSAEQYEGTLENKAFVNELDELVLKTDGWIFGHTHHKTIINFNGIYVMSNPVGYRFEKLEYDKSCCFEI